MYIIWLQLYQRTLKCEQRNKLFGLWYMVFNTTFKNISDISRRSVLLVEETGENRRSVTSHWQTLSHNIVSCRLPWTGLELTTLVMTGTDCTDSCKFNYHAITTTTAPLVWRKKFLHSNNCYQYKLWHAELSHVSWSFHLCDLDIWGEGQVIDFFY